MNRRIFLAASAATLALVSTTALAQAPRTVTLTHSSPANSHFGLAAVTFRDVVEKESNGRFKVVIQRLDNEREALESVQLGSQEFSMGSTGPVGNFVPAVRALDVPFLFRDYAHARGVVDGPIGQTMLKEFTRRNIVGLAFLENGFRHLTTGGKLVEKPDDVKGLKIRTMENPVHMSAGGRPVCSRPRWPSRSFRPPCSRARSMGRRTHPDHSFEQFQSVTEVSLPHGACLLGGASCGFPDLLVDLAGSRPRDFRQSGPRGREDQPRQGGS